MKEKRWPVRALFGLVVTLLVLALVACGKPATGTGSTVTVPLEEIPPFDAANRMTTQPAGLVEFSADGKSILVGSEGGYIRLIDANTGKITWEHKVAEASIESMAFSADGNYVLVGEGSIDSYIYCFDLRSKQEKWRYRTADDIGGTQDSVGAVRDIAPAGSDSVIVAASRRWKDENKKVLYAAKVYRFNLESGKPEWVLPQTGTYDLHVVALATSADGKSLAFSKGPLSGKEELKAVVYSVDAESGTERWSYEVPGFPPHFPGSGVWAGLGISPDGRYIGTFVSFGRGYLFDNQEIASSGQVAPKWQQDIATPVDVSGAILYGYGARVGFIRDLVLFQTGQTYSLTHVYPQKPTVDHPGANSLFAYNMDGTLVWKHYLGGGSSNQPMLTSADGRYVVASLGVSEITQDTTNFGADIIDTLGSQGAVQVVKHFGTEGPGLASAISPDGKRAAVIEAPMKLEDRIMGKYQVHIFSR